MRADRPLRVVVLAPHFAEYATRLALAVARHAVVLLITEVRNRRAECTGLQLGAPESIAGAGYAGDIALRGVSVRAFFERRRIRQAIESFGPDLIHIQEQGDVFTASLAEHYAKTLPLVVTVHDPLPHSGADSLVARRFADGLARIRRAAHAYHVHGAYCAAALRQALATPKPILSTAHGTILEPSCAEVRAPGARYLFFGRMEAYKGIDVLLDAVDLLSREGCRASFVIAGRGPELERWRSRIAANPAIETIDRFLPPAEAIRQFQAARAVLVPYRDATQSGVISAAFGNGRPVIASRVGGLSDAVDEGVDGLLVPPGDAGALAAAIRRMDDTAMRERLTEGARAAAGGRFAWTAIAGRLRELYAELTGIGVTDADPRH